MNVPDPCLVVLIGASGSGKSTFAAKHFRPSEIVSSDACRAMVCDDVNSLEATKDAFELLHYIVGKRLQAGKLAVVDATSVRPEDRKGLLELAQKHHLFAQAVVFDLPEAVCQERNQKRADRVVRPDVVHRQTQLLKRSLRHLKTEGFRVFTFHSQQDADEATVERRPLLTNRRTEQGPFDIIGDVHGCRTELVGLLEKLGYQVQGRENPVVVPPPGRRAIFVGDLTDRGPDTPGVLRLVMSMVASGAAICVPGNHEVRLVRRLRGHDVKPTHGLQETLDQLKMEPPAFQEELVGFLDGLVSHFVLDEGRLVVAHAGLPQEMHGRASGAVRSFALYGETTGETDEFGLPIRYDWAERYRGKALVVYGHTPVLEAEFRNNTICLDTGCVFGGKLTALRYPEKELVSVPAAKTYYDPIKPLAPPKAEMDRFEARILDVKDVLGKRSIETEAGRVTVREENAAAALEVMSRYAIDPRWLAYLPPTMPPPGGSSSPELLEHPLDAFEEYRKAGVRHLVCEEKHMGSRALVIVCRDVEAARRRFADASGRIGVCYTRSGRAFFDDAALERQFLSRLQQAIGDAGLWDELATDWVLLDGELMPWSAKAQGLLEDQYAAVAAAGRQSLQVATAALDQAATRHPEAAALSARFQQRAASLEAYQSVYGRYCWPVQGIEGLRFAPFQVLAAEAQVLADRDHIWHMGIAGRLASACPDLVQSTGHVAVDLEDHASIEAAATWWETMTAVGGEGMVVKPREPPSGGRFVLPGIKVRGPEYLRLVYGPEYLMEGNLQRVKSRNVARKRDLSRKESILGMEALRRAARGEPLYRVHECVFGVLAMESEPVDPRL